MPRRHALLGPILTHAFDALGISASVWTPKGATLWSGHGGVPDQWYAIHTVRNIAASQFEHGRSCAATATMTAASPGFSRLANRLARTHAGFHDLFVPIGDGAEVRAVLLAGPLRSHGPPAPISRSGARAHPFARTHRRSIVLRHGANAFDHYVRGSVARCVRAADVAFRAPFGRRRSANVFCWTT